MPSVPASTTTSEPPKPAPRRATWRFLAWLTWLCVLGTILAYCFAALWPPMLDSSNYLVGVISTAAFFARTFELQAGLALIIAGLVGLILGRKRLVAISLLAAAVHLAPFAWTFRTRSVPPATPQASTLTVMSMNLMYGRADTDVVLEMLDTIKPDVLLLQEYTQASETGLGHWLAARFPYSSRHPRADAFGQAIFSTTEFAAPVRDFPPAAGFTEPQMLAKLRIGGRTVNLLNVHILPPVSRTYAFEQRRQASALATMVRTMRETSPDEAMIVAGDFNCTPRGPHVKAMLAAGLSSAWADAGFGPGHTWIAIGELRYLPGFRLDHVLYGGPLRVLGAGVGTPMGSDHLATWGKFEVLPVETANTKK